jgi:uncharacterized protein
VKISKYCNLRCSYCYEFPELAKKERMPLDHVRTLFRNIARYVIANQYVDIQFVWHGGEPLLIPLDYYDEIAELQKEIFTDKVSISNGVQTNLTVLTDRHLQHLREKRFFSLLGVSVDTFGDQRIDKRGRQTTPLVLENIQRLIDANVAFGGIVVIARNTIAHVTEICRFFDKLGINVRFLPFYLHAADEAISNRQIEDHSINFDELIGVFKLIIDQWFLSSNATIWNPLDEYLDFALSYLNGNPKCHYNRFQNEAVFVVNLDGQVWGAGDTYLDERCYGNLLRHDFGTILASEGRKIRSEQADERMQRYCAPCPYYGACPGFYVGDASIQQELLLEHNGCPVRLIVDEVLKKLKITGLGGVLAPPGIEASQDRGTHYGRNTFSN